MKHSYLKRKLEKCLPKNKLESVKRKEKEIEYLIKIPENICPLVEF